MAQKTGVINIAPKLPVADDEYTPAQRRVIDARLRKARKGPYHGPFDSVDEMLASLKGKQGSAEFPAFGNPLADGRLVRDFPRKGRGSRRHV